MLQVTQLDVYLSYQQAQPQRPNCLDRLWLFDERRSTGFLCLGARRRLLLVTSANKLVVRFLSGALQLPGSKGFWLYYQGTYMCCPVERASGSTIRVRTRAARQQGLLALLPGYVHALPGIKGFWLYYQGTNT